MSESTLTAGAENTDAATTSSAAEAPAGGTTLLASGEAATTQQPSAAQAETQLAAEGKPASDETAAQGAPETYTEFTAPEGVTLDPDTATEFASLAKDLGLSQDNAQKVVDAAAKLTLKSAEAQTAQVATIHADWVQQSTDDKEFGGDKLAESLATAKAAMQATATPQLQMLLDRSGLGNHPEVIRHFLKIAPAFAPDKFVPGGTAPPSGNKSADKVLYPNNA